MKTYTSIDHDSHWPVGCASVVMAKDRVQARKLLNKALKDRGLKVFNGRGENAAYSLHEVKPNTAVVLNDGEY